MLALATRVKRSNKFIWRDVVDEDTPNVEERVWRGVTKEGEETKACDGTKRRAQTPLVKTKRVIAVIIV